MAMGFTRTVRASDVVRILRIQAELQEMTGDFDASMHYALESTCRLLGAQVGAVAFAEQFNQQPGSKPRYLRAWEGGWMGNAERAEYFRYLAGDHSADACVPKLAATRGKLVTRYRQQLVPDNEWYKLENVNESRRAARVDHVLYSLYRTDEKGNGIVFGLHRPWGDRRAFGEQERTLLQLLHRAIVPQLCKRNEARAIPELTPRQQETLTLLLQGLPDKQIARQLRISIHTVHDHVKEIYRRLEVTSRPELLATLFRNRRFGIPGTGDTFIQREE